MANLNKVTKIDKKIKKQLQPEFGIVKLKKMNNNKPSYGPTAPPTPPSPTVGP